MASSPFRPADPSLFFSKQDPNDPRLGDFARSAAPAALGEAVRSAIKERGDAAQATQVFALGGYPDDEGIRANGGRPGAALAPSQVRRWLYRMTPSSVSAASRPAILDVGDLAVEGLSLEERHERAREVAGDAMSAGAVWLAVGGGHDYGFADAAAFSDWCAASGARPLVVNFDAHLDVRPYRSIDGALKISSGTPFSRWLDAFPESDFFEVGLQGQCNSSAHLEWAKARGARFLFWEEVESSGRPWVESALDRMADWAERRRPAFLSVDIDSFSSAWAPGCSQSFATGFSPSDFFPLLQTLLKRLDVRALAIYETSPPLDADDRTSKLAAQILHRAAFPL